MRRKQNFESDTAVLTFIFRFLSSRFFRFACLIFSFCWAFSRLHLGGKIFRRAFRILGLDERKGRWIMEQGFHGNFQLNVTWFQFAFFSGVLD